jgi:hypothetical protein
MLARTQGGGRGRVVLVVRQGDDDSVDFPESDDLAPVGEGFQIVTDELARRIETLGTATAHRADFNAVQCEKVPQMCFAAKPAGSE